MNLIGGKGGISVGDWPSIQSIIISSPLNISAGCGDREMCRLIARNSRKFLFCCHNEIGVVDSLPLNEIALKVENDGDGED